MCRAEKTLWSNYTMRRSKIFAISKGEFDGISGKIPHKRAKPGKNGPAAVPASSPAGAGRESIRSYRLHHLRRFSASVVRKRFLFCRIWALAGMKIHSAGPRAARRQKRGCCIRQTARVYFRDIAQSRRVPRALTQGTPFCPRFAPDRHRSDLAFIE